MTLVHPPCQCLIQAERKLHGEAFFEDIVLGSRSPSRSPTYCFHLASTMNPIYAGNGDNSEGNKRVSRRHGLAILFSNEVETTSFHRENLQR